MKRIFFLTFLIFLFQNVQAEEQKLSQAYQQNLIERAKAVFSPEIPPELELPICAAPIFVEINFHKGRFSSKITELLKPYIARPDFGENPEYTFDTPSGHFKIHYTTTGEEAVFEAFKDDNPTDGVPDYVNRCADFFDSAWAKEVDGLGYNPPPSDHWYQPNGGDGRYDVYLKNINQFYYGYTKPETSSGSRPNSYTSFIVVRNDYPICYGHLDKLDCLKATSAHEFFHAIQFGYDGSEFEFDDPNNERTYKPYWIEMSATWMEDMVFDEVNDYRLYLGSFFKHPEWSLKTFTHSEPTGSEIVRDSVYHPYGSCVWPIFLSEKFNDVGIIRRIWEECAKVPGNNVIDYPGGRSATDLVLEAKGSDFEEAFREFTVWNYFTKARARPPLFYSEGHMFPEVKADTHQTYPVDVISPSRLIGNLGSSYVVFVPIPQTEGGVRIDFDGHSAEFSHVVSVLGYRPDPLPPLDTTIFLNPFSMTGTLNFYNWNFYNQVVMIPAVIKRNPNISWSWEYHATYDSTLHGESPLPREDQILQNYPNPFVIQSESDLTYFPFVLSASSRVRIDIFTLSGEKVKTLIPQNDPEYPAWEYLDKIYAVPWDGRNEAGEYVSSGIYLYRFRTDRATVVKKMAVIR